MASPNDGQALPSAGMLAQSLGVSLEPYLAEAGRLVVAPAGEGTATVLKLVQAEPQG